MTPPPRIAYFSMEIGLAPEIPTYGGGLGMLAGDTVRAAADLGLPLVAVSLLHRQGYFDQVLDADGTQHERPVAWTVGSFLEELPPRVTVPLAGRTVTLRAWRYLVRGLAREPVPVYLLDSDLPENTAEDRTLTDRLYGGDARYRLSQEVLLGLGGVRMLRALGGQGIERFHMNEGHAALLALELMRESAAAAGRPTESAEDLAAIRPRCVFTTHTPLSAGHDQFPPDLVREVLGAPPALGLTGALTGEGALDMTRLALAASRYVNGVAKRHGEVSQQMFADHQVEAITNGVHAATWTAPSVQTLFDRYLPEWRQDNFSLRHALRIPKSELWLAHQQAKGALLDRVRALAHVEMEPGVLTLGFARRATAYKRPDLLFRDLERLAAIATGVGPLQVVYAGKAHPRDEPGKALIRRILQAQAALAGRVAVAYLENYDMALGRLMTAGVDVWLNTPQPPLEASGTSGMKAALNGVPSLSVLDGWWVEGHIEGVTGWAIGEDRYQPGEPTAAPDERPLYEALERVVVPLFYRARDRFLEVMRHTIALNGSYFNAQRMLQQYVVDAYFASRRP